MKTWQEMASAYYFETGLSVNDISAATGISRQSISAYLKGCDGYAQEKQRRREGNREKRREYKKAKNREYRGTAHMQVTAESMRREHDLAALELSREIYH